MSPALFVFDSLSLFFSTHVNYLILTSSTTIVFTELMSYFTHPENFILLIFQVKNATDYSNFDHYAKDMDVPPDDLSGWDENF